MDIQHKLLRKKKRGIKRQHSLLLAQWNTDFLGKPLFFFFALAEKILTLRRENFLDHPYTRHQSQAKKSKTSFKAKGN